MTKGELFSLSTADFELSFYGPVPSVGSYALRDFPGGAEVPSKPSTVKKITIQGLETNFPLVQIDCLTNRYNPSECYVTIASKFEKDGQELYLPLFFENTDYQVQLSNIGTRRFSLWHEYSSIRSNLVPFDRHKAFSGSLNFRNNVGVTNFEIRENDKAHLLLTFTVFSIKVDFLQDRQVMIDELTKVHNTLVLQLFTPTKSLGSAQAKRSLGLEWLTNFHNLSSDLLRTIERIEKKAHNQIHTSVEIVPVHKIKRPNKTFTHQLNTHGKKEILNRRNLVIDRRRIKVNTAENRYIKFLMRHLTNSGKRWIKYIYSSNWESLRRIRENEVIVGRIETNIRQIQQALQKEFWKSVGDELPTLQNKTGFLFHELFMKFEKLYKTINRAISVHLSGTSYIHTLSMDRLYEVWAYCKLAEVISGIVIGGDFRVIPKAKIDTFQAILRTGRDSRVNINDEIAIGIKWVFLSDTGNTYFSPLVPQEPDLIFEVKTHNELNLLDAKYRINVLEKRETRYYSLGIADLISEDLTHEEVKYQPKDEDINTMHRYKDSIRKLVTIDGNISSRSATRIGVILYPHKPDYSESGEIKSSIGFLGQFGIGAVPLTPGEADDGWLNAYKDLDKLIPDTARVEQIRIFANIINLMIESTNKPL